MKRQAFITKTEHKTIERKWETAVQNEKAKLYSQLTAVSSVERKLKRRQAELASKLTPYFEARKKGTVVLTRAQKRNTVEQLTSLKDVTRQIEEISKQRHGIETKNNELEKTVTDNISTESATLANNKTLQLTIRDKLESDADFLGDTDYLLIFIATSKTQKKNGAPDNYPLLEDIHPKHLSEFRSSYPKLKLGIISHLSIYDLMTKFSSYFIDIDWTLIRSLEDFDGPLNSATLTDVSRELELDLQQMRIIDNSLGFGRECKELDLKYCFWGKPQLSSWAQFNDPLKIPNWALSPSNAWLTLEVALENGNISKSMASLIDRHGLQVSVLGRYFPYSTDPRHRQQEGALSRCLLAAKNTGFPNVIIDGLATAIAHYPEDTLITAIPDKDDARCKRMSSLLKNLASHPSLQGYSFSNSVLEYCAGAGTLQKISRSEKSRHLKINLHLKDVHQVELAAVLVIDDIVTSGATLSRVNDLLVNNGAERVDFIAMAGTI